MSLKARKELRASVAHRYRSALRTSFSYHRPAQSLATLANADEVRLLDQAEGRNRLSDPAGGVPSAASVDGRWHSMLSPY